MTSFLDKCFEFFKTRCLYEVLGITTRANESEVKKAYYRMSLKVHPDRATETFRQLATEQFQILGKVYSILSDTEKRAVYDESGTVDEDDSQSVKDWESYWRLLFKQITPEDIEKFRKEYQGSGEEIKDLKHYYEYYKGDMDKIMESVPCAEIQEESRLREILLNCIKQDEIKDYSAFSKEKKSKRESRKKRFAKEAEEAEETMKELGLNRAANSETNSLEAMIMKRQEEREKQADSFFASLEARYGGKKSRKAKPENSSVKHTSPARPKQIGTKRKR